MRVSDVVAPVMPWVLAVAGAFLLSACELGVSLPEGVMQCDDDTDCPSGWKCRRVTVQPERLCFRAETEVADVDSGRDAGEPEPDAGRDADAPPADTGVTTDGAAGDATGADAGAGDAQPGDAAASDASDAGGMDASDAGDAGAMDASDASDAGGADANDAGDGDASDAGDLDAGDAGDAGHVDASDASDLDGGDAGDADAGDVDAGDASAEGNNDPLVEDLSAEPDTVSQGGVSEVVCAAWDPDGDDVSYQWEAASGSFEGTTDADPWRVNWIAPDANGLYVVVCRVLDARGGQAQENITLGVSDPGNSPPDITGMNIGNRVLVAGGDTNVNCFASDPDLADSLTLTWGAQSGIFDDPSAGTTIWTAGGAPGRLHLTCQVTDGNNGVDTERETVRVYPTGLIAYYPFSLDTNDASGNGHAGTATGAFFSTDSSGEPSSSLEFDGNDDNVTLADESAFDLDAYSFVAVVNLTAANHDRTIVSKAAFGLGNFTIWIRSDEDFTWPGHLEVGHEGAGGGEVREVYTAEPFPVGQYVHLAVTVSAVDGIAVYINGAGVLQSFAPIAAPGQNDAAVVVANGPLGGFSGILDEVQFYDRVLPASEIEALVSMQ